MLEDIRKHPELKPRPEFVEMTREEQMKYLWEQNAIKMKLNPERYFKTLESSLMNP